MGKSNPRKMILEDGTEYLGYGFGDLGEKKLELVFNTSMVGYQEILSDPSYTDQAVVMTYPLIGNYGINNDDYETKTPGIGAMIVREYTPVPSNFRSKMSLSEYMSKYGIAGIEGVDTREITRKIRNYGSCKVLLTDVSVSAEDGVKLLKDWNYAHDQVARASTKEIWTSESDEDVDKHIGADGHGQSTAVVDIPEDGKKCHVVAIDCGMKLNIVRSLNRMGCKVTVVPWNTSADEIRALKPDGVFLSNGPGDPVDADATIKTVTELHGEYPTFGICLGHQILSLSYGAKTYKLKFGHRGGNHPVKNVITDKIEITSQNHSYAVRDESLEKTKLKVTHINILDNTIEGVCAAEDRAFSIQYHPESAPGPQDSAYLFGQFIDLMKGGSINA